MRYKEHRSGRPWTSGARPQSASVFKRMRSQNGEAILRKNIDTILRRSMTDHYGWVSKEESQDIEEALVLTLRKAGHAVNPKKLADDVIPFESYREN